jgi:DNA primase
MSAIDEVKQKIDIAEVIGQYTTLKKAGRNLTALCPFHSEKHPSFFVFPERQSWHCFGACNTGGDVFAFIMKKESLEFGEALRLLADKAGVILPARTEPGIKKEEKDELYRANEAAALYFHNLLLNHPAAEKARQYVGKRGFTPRTVADFQLGFSLDAWETLKTHLLERGHSEATLLTVGLIYQSEDGRTHDRFRGKLMIPITDSRGRVTGFGARVLDDSLPKYINSPQTPTFDKSATLYAIDRAAASIRKQDTAIIMEGYMDVITAHQNGITNAVASMGTAITETQVNTLRKLSKNLFLVLDADAAGVEAMLRGGIVANKPSPDDLALRFESKGTDLHISEKDTNRSVGTRVVNFGLRDINVKVLVLPENQDPDDIIKNDLGLWNSLIEKAVPVYDFIFNKLTSDVDLSSANGKSVAVERLLPIVSEIFDPIRQAHYLQKLAGLVKVDMNTIKSSLSQLKPAAVKRKTPSPKPSLPLSKDRREEYCLALLLQHAELREYLEEVNTEYFESSENREILAAYKDNPDVVSLKERVDTAIQEHLEAIINRNIPALRNNIEPKFLDCVLELRKRYLKSLAARKAESGDTEDEQARLEADMEISRQMKELDARRSRKHNSSYGSTRSR